MMIFKDTSSHRRGQVDFTPTEWTANLGTLRLIVHRHVAYAKDEWLATCGPFLAQKKLTSKDAEDAKAEALSMIRREVNLVLLAIPEEVS